MSGYVIVGLGNPGKEYALTRHNLGYLVVQALAEQYGWPFKEERRFRALAAKGKVDEAMVHLVLPATYMNESGVAVRSYLDFYKLGPKDLVVVSDDIALPFGTMRLRAQGSAGGHNGLKSVEAHLQTRDYARLRMGIGRDDRADLADYVLDRFTREESEQLLPFIEKGVDLLRFFPKVSLNELMTRVNPQLNSPQPEE
jgi:peptidyl-tRNA hydrolase, PTH1 family